MDHERTSPSSQSDDESEYAYDNRVLTMLSGLKDISYPSVNSTPRHAPPSVSQPTLSHQTLSKAKKTATHDSSRALPVGPPHLVNASNPTHREQSLQSRVVHLERLLKEANDKERVSRSRQEGALNSAREATRLATLSRNDLDHTKALMSSIGVERAGLVSRIKNLQLFLVAEKKARQQAESDAEAEKLKSTVLASQLEASQRGVLELRQLLMEAGGNHADKHASAIKLNERCLRLQDRVAKYKDDLAAALHELEAATIENGQLRSQVQGLQLIIEEMTSREVIQAAEALIEEEESRKVKAPPQRLSSAQPIPVCRMKVKAAVLREDDIDELDDQMEAKMKAILQRKRRAPSRAPRSNLKLPDAVCDSESEEETEEKTEEPAIEEAQPIRIPPAIRFLPTCPISLSPQKGKSPVKGQAVTTTRQILCSSKPPIEVGPIKVKEDESVGPVGGSGLGSGLDGPVMCSSSRIETLRHQLRIDLASDDEL